MGTDEYDLPDDGQDLAGQLAAERTAREKAERELAALRSQRGDAAERSPSATPAGGYTSSAAGPDPKLIERLQDRSTPWPELQKELNAAGFR